jgi:hypothetical protein
MVAGNGSAMIYADPDAPRAARRPVDRLRQPGGLGSDHDLLAALVREPAVAFVAGESGKAGSLSILSRDGEAVVEAAGDVTTYRPLTGDPLEIGGPFCGDRRAWLERTFDGPYPDAVVQLRDQFRSPRSGDLVVVAREGYDFRGRWEIPEHRSGHGSMIRGHMQTPLWSNRPGPARAVRTVDLFATVLDWLAVPLPDAIDAELAWRVASRSPTVG